MNLFEKAIKDRHIVFDKKKNVVTYLPHTKVRSLKNPEEEIQLEAFLDLIYNYHYPPHKLKVSDKVKMGSATKEADIMVYQDDACKSPYIVVECKKRAVSQKQFDEAIDQGFSYAASTNASFVWVTSGKYNAHYEVIPNAIMEREKNQLHRVPKHTEAESGSYQFKKKLYKLVGRFSFGRLFKNPIMSDSLMFMLVMTICTVLLSKLVVEFWGGIYQIIEPFWKKNQLNFGHIFNAIMLCATTITLLFGMMFMRSHRLMGTPQLKRQLDFVLIASILFLPAWYMSVSNSDPTWWYWSHYQAITLKTKIYLWPFLKAAPFQLLAVYAMIWLMTKNGSPKKKSRKKRK